MFVRYTSTSAMTKKRRVLRSAEDPVGQLRREQHQGEDDERRIDRLDDEVEADDLAPPEALVAVEVEAGEDAVHAGRDEHVDDRDGRKDELETPELGRRDEVGVERDEQERRAT